MVVRYMGYKESCQLLSESLVRRQVTITESCNIKDVVENE